MTLNEWGLYDIAAYEKSEKQTAMAPSIPALASETEEKIYTKLGLAYVEPEMREDRGEVEASREKRLPLIIARSEVRGDLHTHTHESDGTATIEEMAAAAKALGYEFLAITDHSKALAMANGLSVDRLLKHIENIHRISSKLKGITLLAGSEVDIMVDGRLDYDDDVLKELDVVVASPHVSLKQDTAKATARLLRAIDNKYVNIIGHPTGRLINGRAGLPLDMEKIFKAAADSGTALEINAGYPRLDLNDVNARGAIDAGAMLAINTDAHSTGELDLIFYGIDVARRAWATKANVINCMKLDVLMALLKKKR
jgi:DNA polymerase (family 10)